MTEQIKNKGRSFALVAIQFICMGGILLAGPLLPTAPWTRGLAVLALVFGLWALLTMPRQTLSALPDVRAEAELVTTGPYRYVRHPMYTAALLLFLAYALDDPQPLRIGLWLALLLDLWLKLDYEEELLVRRFSEYRAYRKRTACLIPFVL
jgi:protein-S-isoprenylcysteine O-methyltransferase Ste14